MMVVMTVGSVVVLLVFENYTSSSVGVIMMVTAGVGMKLVVVGNCVSLSVVVMIMVVTAGAVMKLVVVVGNGVSSVVVTGDGGGGEALTDLTSQEGLAERVN